MADEKERPKIDSKFRYVLVAAQRAEQLIRGARAKVDSKGKPTRVAMEEVNHEMIDWDFGPAPAPEPAPAEGSTEERQEAAEEVH